MKIFKYLKPYWFFALMAPLTMIGEVVMDLIQPKIMADIVNIGLVNGFYDVILTKGVLMLALSFVGGLMGFASAAFASAASQGFAHDLRKDCFSKIMSLSFQQTDSFTTGSLVTRMTNDITMIQNLVNSFIRMFVRMFAFFFGGLFFLLSIKAEFGYVLLVMIPFEILAIFFFLRRVAPYFRKVQERRDDLNSVMQENVSGSRVVKAYVREAYEGERFDKANINLSKTMIKVGNIMSFLMPIMSIMMNATVVIIIVIGGLDVRNIGGDLLVGDVMSAISYVSRILNSVMMFGMMFQTITQGRSSIERVNQILNTKPVIVGGDKLADDLNGVIEFKNVAFKYPEAQGDPVINDFSVKIEKGTTLAILGATGCGKTSLVNLVPRFYDVVEGEVLIDGINVKEFDLKSLRSEIGVVFQKTELFSGTIEENIKWGNEDATFEEVQEACKIAQAHDFIESFSEGYQTMIASKGSSLSGGQKQRLAIARAILRKPKILIFDDATSALDLATEARLYKALRENLKDVTILLVAQRVASAKTASNIAVIDNGYLVALGTNDELLESSKIYQDIYNSQLKQGGVDNE